VITGPGVDGVVETAPPEDGVPTGLILNAMRV
jgi:hypothetical protein